MWKSVAQDHSQSQLDAEACAACVLNFVEFGSHQSNLAAHSLKPGSSVFSLASFFQQILQDLNSHCGLIILFYLLEP